MTADASRIFDAFVHPDRYRDCPDCGGYGSSLDEEAPRCTTCGGDGVLPKEEEESDA